jgi:hypothetical protein
MNKKAEKRKQRDELHREYDLPKLRGRIRGKYAARYKAGTNIVLLSPDVAEHSPDEQSVNSALRRLIRIAKRPLRRSHGKMCNRAFSMDGTHCRYTLSRTNLQ